MSGDKVSKTDKASEIWYRLLLGDQFKKDLEQLKKYKDELTYYFRQHFLFEKYEILPTQRLMNLCDQHIFGKKAEKLGDHFPIRIQTPSDEELKQSRKALIKLLIYDGVTRDEILDYIKKNWKNIRVLLRSQNLPKIKRIRKIGKKKL